MNKVRLLTIIISFLALNKAICMEEDRKSASDMTHVKDLSNSGKLTIRSHNQIEKFVEVHAIRIEIVNIKSRQNYFENFIKNALDMAFDSCEHIIAAQLKHNPNEKKHISKLIKTEVKATLGWDKQYKQLSAIQKEKLNDLLDKLIEEKIQAILKK